MAQSQQYQPGLLDKLMIIPNLSRTILSALIRSVTGPLLGGPKANTYFKDVAFAALRTNLSITSAATEQFTNATSTEAGYLQLAKSKSFQPETTVLDSGSKLHWIGPKTAKKVVLYFHGGGYVLSCSPGHYAFLFDLQQNLSKSKGDSVSVVVVSYTLAPHGQYPKQLQEGAESLQFLLNTQGYKPSDIILAGDSAGGNMATALLLHLLHPHPAAKEIKLASPLASAVLISPWLSFKTDYDSAVRNANSDIVTVAAANRWSSLFLGSAAADTYNQPYLATSTFLSGLDKVVNDILIWGGGGELLLDSIDLAAKKFQEAHPRVELVVEAGAAHEDFIMDRLLGYQKANGEGAELVERWVGERL